MKRPPPPQVPGPGQPEADQPLQLSSDNWLIEFMRREADAEDSSASIPEWQVDESAEKSYRGRVVLGFGVLLLAGLVGGAAYYHIRQVHSAPLAVALAVPAPPHRPDGPSQDSPTARGTIAIASSGVPPQPVDPAPAPLHKPPASLIVAKAPASSVEAPRSEPLPAGPGLHVQIIYRPSDPAEASRIAALAARLRGRDSDIASVTVSLGTASSERVAYFFPKDRMAARRIASRLSRITKHIDRVALVRKSPLPEPGTVEISLPVRVGNVLRKEGF